MSDCFRCKCEGNSPRKEKVFVGGASKGPKSDLFAEVRFIFPPTAAVFEPGRQREFGVPNAIFGTFGRFWFNFLSLLLFQDWHCSVTFLSDLLSVITSSHTNTNYTLLCILNHHDEHCFPQDGLRASPVGCRNAADCCACPRVCHRSFFFVGILVGTEIAPRHYFLIIIILLIHESSTSG